MCLAVPVKVLEVIDNMHAKVEIDGVKLEVASGLVDNVELGDYVLIHAGFIIEKVSNEEAQEKLKIWDEYYAFLEQGKKE